MRDKRFLFVALIVIFLLASGLGYYVIQPTANQPPEAAFVMTPADGEAPLEVRLDGSSSNDPDGSISDYDWDFGDGAKGEGAVLMHRFAKAGEFTVTLTVRDNGGSSHSVSRTLAVRDAARLVQGPPLYDIAPKDGVAVQGAEAWVRWRAALPSTGRVLWRKVGDKDFLRVDGVDAEHADLLLARVGPLKAGQKYEYYVESTAGDSFYQRSELRTFTAEGGLAFMPATVEQTVRPDYDQTVHLTLKNESGGKLKIAARALVQFEDLPADIVGPGSVDDPVELAAGGELKLRLAVAAPDATREHYDIPVEAAGAYALAKVRVAKPDFKLAIRVVGEDAHTLAKTIEVRNEGESLTNLSIQVAPPGSNEIRQEPAVKHAFLPGGASLRVVVQPILYMEFQALTAELVCAAHGQSVRFPVEFKAPPGKRLLGIRTGSLYGSSSKDWYCTNRPNTSTNLPGPPANGPERHRPTPTPPEPPRPCPCKDPYPKTGFRRGVFNGPYDTEEEAAVAALQAINPISIASGAEFGGTIRKFGNKYYWNVQCEGSADCTTLPAGQDPGTWHTHGSPYTDDEGNPLGEGFSEEDLSDLSYTHNEYLGTPTGRIVKYPIRQGQPRGPGGSGPAADLTQTTATTPPKKKAQLSLNPLADIAKQECLPCEDSPAHARPQPRLLRFGLPEALEYRARFTRAHRGPFASALEGDADDSSPNAASWHAGDRVYFAWHQQKDRVVVAAFNLHGEVVMKPAIVGKGRWPRLAVDGKRVAVAWARAKDFIVRVHDGNDWGGEIALSGKEAAIAFPAGGALHAATPTGLWKLADGKFERVQETAYTQPSLAFDAKGEPHVAWRRDGRVVYDGKEVAEGERPTLVTAPDGTTHLAYLTKAGIVVRSRKGDDWAAGETHPIRQPSWPALALGADGLRLTYLGAAEHGPDALWLLPLTEKEPVLMPSLGGNVAEAWMVLHFGLKNARSQYRPHNVAVVFNGAWLKFFENQIPEGRYLFRIDPNLVFTAPGRPIMNQVSVRTWHMNGGNYSTSSEYHLAVRTAWSEQFAFASSAGDVRKARAASAGINHDKPDLAVLANSLNLPTKAPKEGNIDLPVTVANLGEATSNPTRLALRSGNRALANVDIPALLPNEQFIVTFRLEGSLAAVEFRLEPSVPDFDPTNDVLTLRLWDRDDSKQTKAAAAARVLPMEMDVAADLAIGEIDPEVRLAYRYDNRASFGLTIVKDQVGKKSAKRLTYAADGGTNNTLVRIDGKDHEFGRVSGKLTARGVKLPPDPARQARERSQSTWEAAGIRVTQTLEIVPGRQPVEVAAGVRKRLLDTCVVRYLLENIDGKPHKIGLRLQIDTLIGNNDGVPFTVPGLPGLVTKFKDFPTAAEVPEFVQALEQPDLRNPGTVAHLTLRFPGLEPPGRLSLTNWAGSGAPWEVPLRDISGDSAAVLYWPELELPAGAKRELGFAYGVSSVAAIGGGAKLAINVEGRFQVGRVFTALAYVHNPVPGEKITLILPDGLELAGGRMHEPVPLLSPGVREGNSLLTWKITAKQAGAFQVVMRSSAGAEERRTVTIAAPPQSVPTKHEHKR